MKFVWTKSGDYLDVDVESISLVEHWLDVLPSNKFIIKEDKFPYESFTRLEKCIHEINNLFKSKFHTTIFDYNQFEFNQDFLNKMHRSWADIQIEKPALPLLLEKMGTDYLQMYYDINESFHSIESRCRIKYVEQDSNTIFTHQLESLPDITKYAKHGRSQLYLDYWSLGRTDFDAWQFSDNVGKITNFDKLPYTLDVSIKKPYNSKYPESYIQWMKQQGKDPIGSYLPIGNFSNYTESVYDLYEIFLFNNKIEQTVELVL